MKTGLLTLAILAAALLAGGCSTTTGRASRLLALQERMDAAGVEKFEVNTNYGGVNYEVTRTETERVATLEVNSIAAPRAFIRTRKPITKE